VSARPDDAAWRGSLAAALIGRARQLDAAVPAPGARERVRAQLEARRTRPVWRFAWPAFAAGAACASVVALALIGRVPAPVPARPFTVLALDGGGRMVASAGAVATLDRAAVPGGERLRLERGSVLLHVTPRPAGAPFVVETRDFTAKVVGTVLRVVVHDDGRATIAVGHGAVEVTPRGGAPTMVRTGARWPSDSADVPGADELAQLGPDHLEGATFVPSPAAAADATAGVGAACRGGTADARLACELARAESTDPLTAESALYEAGWIALREQSNPARALALWQRERARFPRGVLARDAQTSIVDALLALGLTGRARVEIADYLRAVPDGLRAGELHYVLATLYRAADGTCRRAGRELDLALARPAAPWASRARALRDRCAHSSARAD
jgi:FecR protein